MVKSTKVEEPAVGIDKFIGGLVSEYRDTNISMDSGHVKCDFIDSGNIALNYILSGSFDHGIPVGQLTEINGESASGKSLLLQYIIASFLDKYKDGVVFLDDAEHAYVEYLGSKLKIDTSRLVRISSDTVEDHANLLFIGGKVGPEGSEIEVKVPLVQQAISKGVKHILVALDSIAVLSTRHEQDIGLEKPELGKAKLLKALLRVVTPSIKRDKITYIVTNHLISQIAQGPASFGPPQKITPGGGGPVYQAAVRLQLVPAGKIKRKDTHEVLGAITKPRTIKNRFAPPFRQGLLEIFYEHGMSKYSGLIELLKKYNIVEVLSGGWYGIVGSDSGKGKKGDKVVPIKFQSKDLSDMWPTIQQYIKDGKIQLRGGESVDNVEVDDQKEEVSND